jgi:PAS domain S-box-containing protein
MNDNYKTSGLFTGVPLLVATVMMVVVSLLSMEQITEMSQKRNNTSILQKEGANFVSNLMAAETNMHGYLLTGDEGFLRPYLTIRDTIRSDLKKIRQNTINSTENKEALLHLDTLTPMVDAKLAYMSLNIKLFRSHNMTAVFANVNGALGIPLMNSIYAEMNSFIQIQEDKLAQDNKHLNLNMRRLHIVFISVSILMILLAITFPYFFYRETQHRFSDFIIFESQRSLEMQTAINEKLTKVNADLQISEEKFSVTLDSIGDAVLATDAEGRLTIMNPIAEGLMGWTLDEAAGRTVTDIFCVINEETRQQTFSVMKTLKNGAAYVLPAHTILIAHDGTESAVDGSCAPILNHDGQVTGAVLIFHNIDERREIEIGLEKTRKELIVIKKTADEVSEFAESIINTVREPLLALNQDLRVVTASRSFYDFFKVKPSETEGQLIYDLGNKQWDIPKLRELLETILPQKTTFDNYEVEHDFTTIGRRIMLLNARQIERRMGKEKIILLAIEDITGRKGIEADLEKKRDKT